MKASQLFSPTLRESPKEAEIISHQLMLRAGMIKQVASGIYTYLPLGYRVIRKFEQIIREEMDKSGAQEVLMPMVIPADLWKKSGRWDEYGKELLRVQDRLKREFCLGPTHEEVITDVIGSSIHSYKQLPVTLYQIQTKFRDEMRPRFGIMRGREFGMKDAYSFHVSAEDLDQKYTQMIDVYKQIFKRCGLDTKVVAADSGSIGGSESAEFMITAETGEDTILECPSCGYTANMEVIGDEKTCTECKEGTFKEIKGIEVGHIFKLGNKYSQEMEMSFLDQNGKRQYFEMGCYGVGVGRTVAATIEQFHDEKGIVWPMQLAPYRVVIIVSKPDDEELGPKAESLYQTLQEEGIEVVYDDRKESIGVKFKDADLIGYPVQIVLGRTTKETGDIEIKDRSTNKTESVALEGVSKILKDWGVYER